MRKEETRKNMIWFIEDHTGCYDAPWNWKEWPTEQIEKLYRYIKEAVWEAVK